MNDYKKRTSEVFRKMYDKTGYEHTLAVAGKVFTVNYKNKDLVFRSTTHGELCETILTIAIDEFIKRNPTKTDGWFYKQGLILKDLDNTESKFLTELDVVLFTPACIIIFECKSYSGEKEISKQCLVKHKGKTMDVYSQNKLHSDVLIKNLQPFRLSTPNLIKPKEMQLVFFNFSKGEITDKRTDSWKAEMPCIDITNIMEFLLKYTAKPKIWNMACLKRAADIIAKASERNRAKHLAYVKEVNARRNKTE